MTSKFVGQFEFKDDKISKIVETETIPPKQEWNKYAIWEFNGKRYKPVTQKAINDLETLVKQLQAAGYVGATKAGKRKPTSIKYAVCTLGVEDFKLIK